MISLVWTTILRQLSPADQSVWAASHASTTIFLSWNIVIPPLLSGSADCFWRRIVFKYSLSYSKLLFYSMVAPLLRQIGRCYDKDGNSLHLWVTNARKRWWPFNMKKKSPEPLHLLKYHFWTPFKLKGKRDSLYFYIWNTRGTNE